MTEFQYFSTRVFVPQTVKINHRGSLTLPADIRKLFHLKGDDLLIVEPTAHGILLRPAQPIPIQFFNDAQSKSMERMERELAAAIASSHSNERAE